MQFACLCNAKLVLRRMGCVVHCVASAARLALLEHYVACGKHCLVCITLRCISARHGFNCVCRLALLGACMSLRAHIVFFFLQGLCGITRCNSHAACVY